MVNVKSIHHLALFICHLFIDGHFRTAHFLYTPNSFEFDWLSQIDAICPEPIPFYLTDITSTWEWPWNPSDNPNNVLQLNFFNTKNLAEDFDELKKNFTNYRVFCFSSTDDAVNEEQRPTIFTMLHRQFSDSNVLLVDYNTENVSVFIDSNSNSNEKSILQPIVTISNKTNFEEFNLFDRTFGELERMQSIALQRVEHMIKSAHGEVTRIGNSESAWLHYYHLHLNNSFINMTWIDDEETPPFQTNQQCVLQSSNYYKELSHEYQCTANGNSLKNEHTIGLHVILESLKLISNHKNDAFLRPYHSRELKVIFVYGTDYKREIDIFRVSKSIKIVAALIVSVLIMAIIILFAIRKRFNLPGNDIVSCIVDCVIPFIGGGSLRMEHRFERWFFGILMVGVFFMVSVIGGDLVDSVVRVLVSKIETFEDLARINPPVYVDNDLLFNYYEILRMVRTKMGENMTDLHVLNYAEQIFQIQTSYVVILAPDSFDLLVTLFDHQKRDYDILKEPLGEILDRYILTSDQRISERTITKMAKVIKTMTEYGFYQFYHSLSVFERKWLIGRAYVNIGIDKNEINLESITIEQMNKPIMIALCLNVAATIVFIAEILVFKWLKWRNCRVQILPLVKRQLKPKSQQQQQQSIDLTARQFHSAAPEMGNANHKSAKQHSKKRRSARF